MGCAQPALLTCPAESTPCADGCVDLATTHEDCGACGVACGGDDACVAGVCVRSLGACADASCSLDAVCMDVGGAAVCLCKPGLHGDGHSCAACTMCGPQQFVSAPCS